MGMTGMDRQNKNIFRYVLGSIIFMMLFVLFTCHEARADEQITINLDTNNVGLFVDDDEFRFRVSFDITEGLSLNEDSAAMQQLQYYEMTQPTHTLLGWFNKDTGEVIEQDDFYDYQFNESVQLYALWDSYIHTVTFVNNNGYFEDDPSVSQIIIEVPYNKTIGEAVSYLPFPNFNSGGFDFWKCRTLDCEDYSISGNMLRGYIVPYDITVNVSWRNGNSDYYVAQFHPGKGEFTDEGESDRRSYLRGNFYGDLDAPEVSRNSWVLLGWSLDPDCTDASGLFDVNTDSLSTNSINHFYAVWEDPSQWEYSEGVLTITSPGAMPEYDGYEDVPWADYRNTTDTIVISEGVTSISKEAFYGFSETDISLPNSLEEIGAYAFADNDDLTAVDLPATLQNIGEYAFTGCDGITEAVIRSGEYIAGKGIFAECPSLETAVLDEVVFDAGSDLSEFFLDCSALNNASMQMTDISAVEKMDSMFKNCSALEEIDLYYWDMQSVTSADSLFSGCDLLAKVHVGDGIRFRDENNKTMFTFGQKRLYLHSDWWSLADGCRYSGFDIAYTYSRNPKEDTYTKIAPWTTTDGLWGSCIWKMTVENEVYVYPGTGADSNNSSPWLDYRDLITGIYFFDGVVFPESCYSLFESLPYLTAIEFGDIDTSATVSMGHMFSGDSRLTSIDLSRFDTGMVTDMNGMFSYCYNLESIDLSGKDLSNVTDMGYLFYECSSLIEIELSQPTGAIRESPYAFNGCSSLVTLDISGLDMRSNHGMTQMFAGCDSLEQVTLGDNFTFRGAYADTIQTSLPKGKWLSEEDGNTYHAAEIAAVRNLTADTYTFLGDDGSAAGYWGSCHWVLDTKGSLTIYAGTGADNIYTNSPWIDYRDRITSIHCADGVVFPESCYSIFGEMPYLTVIEFGDIDTSATDSMGHMFSGDSRITAIDLSQFDTGMVTDMNGMFSYCYNLESIDLSGKDLSNVTDMGYLFYECSSLIEIELSQPTGAIRESAYAFNGCSSLVTLDISGLDMRSNHGMTQMFAGCDSLEQVTLGDNFTFRGAYADTIQTSLPKGKWLSEEDGNTYHAAEIAAVRNLTADTYTFLGDDGSAAGYWGSCHWVLDTKGSLTIYAGTGADNIYTNSPWIDYRDRITSIHCADGVVFPESCYSLFESLPYLTAIEFGDIDTSATDSMGHMFSGDSRLTAIDLSQFDTGMVTDMNGMFSYCYNLESIDLSGKDLSNVTDMGYLFYECSSLIEIELSQPTGAIRESAYAFNGCSSLVTLDISGLDMRSNYGMKQMFVGCDSLELITLGENFTFKGSSEDTIQVNLPTGTWYSKAADDYFTSDQISSYRDGIADVYTRDAIGYWGSCRWTLHGWTLTVEAGNGVKTWGVSPWEHYAGRINTVCFENGVVFPAECSDLLFDFPYLTSIIFGDVDTSGIKSLAFAFSQDTSLTEIDLGGLDLLSVTDINGIFHGDISLVNVSFGGCRMPKLLHINNAFQECSSLQEIDLSGIEAYDITDTIAAFYGCSSLTSLDLTGIGTVNATEMYSMFNGCDMLETISLGEYFSFTGNGTEVLVTLPAEAWVSAAEVKKYTSAEIAETRNGIADTYTRAKSLEDATITITPESFVYNGEEQCPEIVIELDGITLTEEEDYTVTYPENMVDAATLEIVIEAAGLYIGEAAVSYEIEPAPIADQVFSIRPEVVVSAGIEMRPLVSCNLDNEETECYTVEYTDNIEPGTGHAVITGIGNYAGSVDLEFTILDRDSLNTIILPAELTTIEAEAFAGIDADIIVLSETCTEIGSRAFADCTNLKEIVIPGTSVLIEDDAFGVRTDIIIRTTPDSNVADFAAEKGIWFYCLE